MSENTFNLEQIKLSLQKENINPSIYDSENSLSSSIDLDESFHNYLKNNVSNELKEKFFTNTNANHSNKSDRQTMETSNDKTRNIGSADDSNSTTSSTPYEEDSLNIYALTAHRESIYEEDSIEIIPVHNANHQEDNARIDQQQSADSIILINSSSDDNDSSINSSATESNNRVNQSTDYFTSDEILIKKENRDCEDTYVTISSDNNTNKSYESSSYQTANLDILSNENSLSSRFYSCDNKYTNPQKGINLIDNKNVKDASYSLGNESSLSSSCEYKSNMEKGIDSIDYNNGKYNKASYSLANSTDTSLNSNECQYVVNSSETSNDEQIHINNTKHSLSSSNDANETLSLSSHQSSASNNRNNDDNEERKFNDTLEEVEFLIEQGMKIKAMECLATPVTPTSDKILNNKTNFLTPESRKATPKTPNTVILKSKYQTIHSPMDKYFKKPPILPQQPSRIPKPQHQRLAAPSHAVTNKRFDHIISPISQYIKSGQSPLVKNIPAVYERNFFDSSYCQQLDFTQESNNDSILSMDQNTVSLPRKAFIATDYCQMYDNRTQKMPGGASVQRLVGDAPYAIKHEGRIQMGIDQQQNPKINDSFADLSIMPGDLSIQVVKHIERI